MKNILVTGSNGFIGQALVKELENKNFNVFKFDSSYGDISEFDFKKKFKNIEVDYVFHLASKTFIPDSWNDPVKFYKTSVIGTNNILELCRMKEIPLTYVSAYLYGLVEKFPTSEDDCIKPNNPYAHSKFLTEELCKFYSEYYNVKVTIARPFNLYGRNQKDIFLIPHIIKQVMNSNYIEVEVLDLNPKRDYLYINDLINGLLKTMSTSSNFSIYNFGSGKELSVKEAIDNIQKVAKINKPIVSKNIERKNEIISVIADIQKAKEELKWEPLYNFEDGIKEILENIKNEK